MQGESKRKHTIRYNQEALILSLRALDTPGGRSEGGNRASAQFNCRGVTGLPMT